MTLPKTIVYVDGFNLYYGAVKGTLYRWLDLDALFRLLLARNHIVAIKYFTARVTPRPNNPDGPVHQNTYLRALATFPHISVEFGHFLAHRVRLPVVTPTGALTGKFADVLRTEEKGSDVNLAAHLLADAYENAFEVAAVVTGDSDLVMPIQLARSRCGKTVGVLNPQRRESRELKRVASFYKSIRPNALPRCQLPPTLTDTVGTISKPASW
jgi:uncharacterized LabA/DUF88 family protein